MQALWCRSYPHRTGWRGFGRSERSESLYFKEPKIYVARMMTDGERLQRFCYVTQVPRINDVLLDVKLVQITGQLTQTQLAYSHALSRRGAAKSPYTCWSLLSTS